MTEPCNGGKQQLEYKVINREIQGGPEKNAQSFAYDNFWTICRRTVLIAPKCFGSGYTSSGNYWWRSIVNYTNWERLESWYNDCWVPARQWKWRMLFDLTWSTGHKQKSTTHREGDLHFAFFGCKDREERLTAQCVSSLWSSFKK